MSNSEDQWITSALLGLRCAFLVALSISLNFSLASLSCTGLYRQCNLKWIVSRTVADRLRASGSDMDFLSDDRNAASSSYELFLGLLIGVSTSLREVRNALKILRVPRNCQKRRGTRDSDTCLSASEAWETRLISLRTSIHWSMQLSSV